MPALAPSPPVSENEFDIAGALAADSDSDASISAKRTKTAISKRRNATIPVLEEEGGAENDEEFIALTQATSNRKAANVKGRSVKKGGGFQAMGLNANLLKAITRKGFAVPTPIQRRTIPLVLANRDVVGMARTGSGKTAAFVVPMLEKLKRHSAQVGARALIMAPSRELALQTLKVVKELGRGTDLKAVLLVGGDSLEEQFAAMTSNPDIIIATPGRFLHLQVEMSLDLSSIRYVVFDEADRLFEMGFATQLAEILAALPSNRQTMLFSATLPKSLVEFARAGLQEPSLIRLDAESKVSPDLQSAFFGVKSSEKEGALLHVLQDVIKMPTGHPESPMRIEELPQSSKKRKHSETHDVNSADLPTPFSTLVFAATKHHVDYLTHLLRLAGYAVSYVYGSLDQTARKLQVQDFRAGKTHVMVVTDVAARGIDIPILANVINYDFPSQPKVYVHRVGRTARAGKKGWSYSLVADSDVPYLLDLQLFLGRKFVVGRIHSADASYASDVVAGSLERDALERNVEEAAKLLADDVDLAALHSVAIKGEKLYRRTRHSASAQSAKRAKDVVANRSWVEVHPLFGGTAADLAVKREEMLARVSGFRPSETVFEIGRRGHLTDAGEVVRKRRDGIVARKQKAHKSQQDEAFDMEQSANDKAIANPNGNADSASDGGEGSETAARSNENEVLSDEAASSGDELDITISQSQSRNSTAKDDSHYMSYTPGGHASQIDEQAYAVNPSSSSFLSAARALTLDLGADEGGKAFAEPSRAGHQAKRWDRKARKYVNTEVTVAENGMKRGSKHKAADGATILGESGARLSASFRSGRFDAWMKRQRLNHLPRVGEREDANLASKFSASSTAGPTGSGKAPPSGSHRFFHKQIKAPKPADPKRDDYHKQKKRIAAAKEARIGRFGDGEGKRELRDLREVQKERMAKAKRRERSGPGKKGFKSRGKGRK